ncbi:hypothetical protein ZWY2020_027546 [Hordeum vulgare]|nr:hypothetical protein ZWY2020_027546 [Hordeum vulgare]
MANSHEDPRQAGRNEHEIGETSGAHRPPRRSASRHTRRSNVELFRTPLLNLAAAAKIVDSLQPTDSEAGRGIEQIRALLHTAQQQNSAVSQSHNRIHNSSVRANTHRCQFKGVITITGNRQRAEECLQQGSRIADQQMAVLELDEYKKIVDPADLMRSKKPTLESAFQSAGEKKKVNIHPTDDTAAPTNISTTLDPK